VLPLANIGFILCEQGKYDEALDYERRALAIGEKTAGPEHRDTAYALLGLAEALRRQGHPDEALPYYERVRAIGEKTLTATHPIVAGALNGIGLSELARRQPARALPPLERALTLRATPPVDQSDLAETRFGLAQAEWDASRDRTRARKLALAARTAWATLPQHKKDLAEVDAWLAAHR
jgi:tetratricopeptide (TPR) repeat protein